jgi:hypothetical protein
MKPAFPFDDFTSLLDHKYGNTDSPERIAHHRQVGKIILRWRSKFSRTFSQRFLAWCQCYLFRSWKRPAYLDRQLARFGYRNQDLRWLINQTGVAVTALCSQGRVKVMGRTYDATSRSGHIESGTEVVVVEVVSHQLIVEKIAD